MPSLHEKPDQSEPNVPLLAAQAEQRGHEGANAAGVGVVQSALGKHVFQNADHALQVRIALDLAQHVRRSEQRGLLVEADVHVDPRFLGVTAESGMHDVAELYERDARVTQHGNLRRDFALLERLLNALKVVYVLVAVDHQI